MSTPLKPSELKNSVRKSLSERKPGELPYRKNTRKAVDQRNMRAAEWPDFKEKREYITSRRREAIDNLHDLHENLKRKWEQNGVTVHEASDGQEACQAIEKILVKEKADRIVKSKSMLGEEIEINHYLEARGITPVESDLGEYIVQLRRETPSHITMPAMHLTREDVGELFSEKLGVEYTEIPEELTKIARRALREEFLSSRVGLCGVNFAVAETGHIVTVTNEGNGRMVTSMPRVVIAIMGWERVTQSLGDLAILWQMLSRSATGQRTTSYLNMTHSPTEGVSGPDEIHVIVVDNGRKALWEDEEMRTLLSCIRCGACLNACPVYQQIGGHPYGGVYPGPIGSVLTPALFGLENAGDHPFASTLCGACEEICPVSIPIPSHLLKLRQRLKQDASKLENKIWDGVTWMMKDSSRFDFAMRSAGVGQKIFKGSGVSEALWGRRRSAPEIAPMTFKKWYKKRENSGEKLAESTSRITGRPGC